jgi:hypothetical protein
MFTDFDTAVRQNKWWFITNNIEKFWVYFIIWNSEYMQRVTKVRSGVLWQSLSGPTIWDERLCSVIQVSKRLRGTWRSVRMSYKLFWKVGILQEYTASVSWIQHSSFNRPVVTSASVFLSSKINQEINFGGSSKTIIRNVGFCNILNYERSDDYCRFPDFSILTSVTFVY